MSLPFRYFLRVRYSECDAQAIVFNARYGDYIDQAATEFMRALGATISGPGAEEMDYRLRQQTVEWLGPARFDDVLELAVTAEQLGTTSFTLRTDIRIAGSDVLIATAHTVYVMVDSRANVKRAIPADFRRRLEAGASGRCTDHAAYLTQAIR